MWSNGSPSVMVRLLELLVIQTACRSIRDVGSPPLVCNVFFWFESQKLLLQHNGVIQYIFIYNSFHYFCGFLITWSRNRNFPPGYLSSSIQTVVQPSPLIWSILIIHWGIRYIWIHFSIYFPVLRISFSIPVLWFLIHMIYHAL